MTREEDMDMRRERETQHEVFEASHKGARPRACSAARPPITSWLISVASWVRRDGLARDKKLDTRNKKHETIIIKQHESKMEQASRHDLTRLWASGLAN